jgi:hypothetical protein
MGGDPANCRFLGAAVVTVSSVAGFCCSELNGTRRPIMRKHQVRTSHDNNGLLYLARVRTSVFSTDGRGGHE